MQNPSSIRRLKSTASLLALLFLLTALLTIGPPSRAQDSQALRETQVVKVVRKVSPAVVYISCQQRVKNPFADSIWQWFGEDMPGQESEENSLGSGFIVDKSGYILTNEHVILGGSQIKVTLKTGKTYPAKVVGTAPESDLALLKIDGDSPFPIVELGRSSDLMIGETVVAVGNPFGLSNTVTVGVLSAAGRTIEDGKRRFSDFLQTDAPINPGNSGGPLLNILGEVIGVNTAIIRQGQGIGFAIPIDRARRVMEQLKTFGQVRSAWLGFLPLDLTDTAKRRLGLQGGVYVAKVYPFALPAAEVIHEGDYITRMEGKRIESTGNLNAALALLSAGKTVDLEGLRGGKPFKISLTTGLMPSKLTTAMAWELLGIKVQPYRQGLSVVDVKPRSPADDTGLQRGDTILAVEDQPVSTTDEFLTRARSALSSTGLVLSVGRGPWTYYVTLNLVGG